MHQGGDKNLRFVFAVCQSRIGRQDKERGEKSSCLGAFATDTASQLDILWHDGNTLSMDSTQVGVLKETNKVSLCCLLQGKNS